MYTYDQIFKEKNNILFVTAHPDDVIVYFGALIEKLRNDDKNIFVVTVTNGARGSRENTISEEDLANTRITEEIEALKFLKVETQNIECLKYKDGEVESNYKLIGEISKYIRKFKADIVCTHESTSLYKESNDKNGYFIQHRDHRKVGEAVVDSVYPFSRDKSFFPEHGSEGVNPHSVYDILLTDDNGYNFEFDYTEKLETKKSALLLHVSQFDSQKVDDFVQTQKIEDKYFEKFKYLKLLW